MKNFNKIILLVVVSLSVMPTVAFASWWNPATWSIFSKSLNKKQDYKEQVMTSSSTVTTIKKDEDLTLCNGQYWKKCPVSQRLICPVNGEDAYCSTPKIPMTKSIPVVKDTIYSENTKSPVQIPVKNVQTLPQQNAVQIQENTSAQISNRDLIIKDLDQVIDSQNSFNSQLLTDISLMNTVSYMLNDEPSQMAQSAKQLTQFRLGRIMKMQNYVEQGIRILETKRGKILTLPLSSFNVYQFPSDVQEVIPTITETQKQYISDYNSYVTTIQSVFTITSPPRTTYCSAYNSNGITSISCN